MHSAILPYSSRADTGLLGIGPVAFVLLLIPSALIMLVVVVGAGAFALLQSVGYYLHKPYDRARLAC